MPKKTLRNPDRWSREEVGAISSLVMLTSLATINLLVVKYIPRIIGALVLILLAIFLMIHHKRGHGYWLDWKDLNSHEVMWYGMLSFALGIISTMFS